jgi:Protein of unknown function (DUF3147)
MREILLRVLFGGIAVTVFSQLGDLVKPRTFSGLFGAAPSVAIATLVLKVAEHGKQYASIEARSMIFGACAFLFYALLVSRLLVKHQFPVLAVTGLSIVGWFVFAFGLGYLVLGRTG